MSSSSTVYITSQDGVQLTTNWDIACQNETLKNLLEDSGTEEAVPVPNVNGKALKLVLDFCTFSDSTKKEPKSEQDVKKFEEEYIRSMDKETLFDVITAADFLNNKQLLDVTCKAVADMIKGKTPEEIRKEFNIENDLTPEEEEQIRKENAWAFE